MIDVEKISGIGKILMRKNSERVIFAVTENERPFFVQNKNTIEIRTDRKLGKLLAEKYESVMESRYFGRGGIEIVDSGQLKEDEIQDLIRLSYNLTKEMEANENDR